MTSTPPPASFAGPRLVLMRHSKTQPAASSDHARSLTNRGRRDGHEAGRWLAAEGIIPDVVLVSSAARAQQTVDAVVRGLGGQPLEVEVVVLDALYDADGCEVIEICRTTVSADAGCALVVGHNPAMEQAAALLLPEPGSESASEHQDTHLPTSALCVFSWPVGAGWSDLESGRVSLVASYSPRDA